MRALICVLAIVLTPAPGAAAGREVIRTGWDGFREQVMVRGLAGRTAQIGLASGAVVKTKLKEVTAAGLVVRGDRTIPSEQVTWVRFSGRLGHRGLLGALAGAGAGAGIGAAVITNRIQCFEGSCYYAVPAVGAAFVATGAVAGYFIGRATGRPAPEFVITRPSLP